MTFNIKIISEKIKNNFTAPNLISFFRIFLIVPCIDFFLKEEYINVALILLISAISDMFDGLIARKFGQATKFGQMLDPIADKLTLVAMVICLGIKFKEIFIFVAILLLKDVLMIIAGVILLKHGLKPVAAKWYGKLGTAFFYMSLIIIISLKIFNINIPEVSEVLLFITTLIMLFALIKYFIIFLEIIRNKKN